MHAAPRAAARRDNFDARPPPPGGAARALRLVWLAAQPQLLLLLHYIDDGRCTTVVGKESRCSLRVPSARSRQPRRRPQLQPDQRSVARTRRTGTVDTSVPYMTPLPYSMGTESSGCILASAWLLLGCFSGGLHGTDAQPSSKTDGRVLAPPLLRCDTHARTAAPCRPR